MSPVDENAALILALRGGEGGVGKFLTDEKKQRITDGPDNHPENKNPYDISKLNAGVDAFFENHPLSVLELKNDAEK